MAKVNTIKKKNVIRYNNDPCLVLECVIRTPPNLTSFCQMTLRNLVTSKVIHVRCPVSESFDVLSNDVRKVEFLYENQGVYVFIDDETFENYEIDKSIIEDDIPYLILNHHYEVFLVDGVPLAVNIPAVVEMKVAEAPDAVRGDTSGNVQKPVVMETGLTVMAPLFIKQGDILRVKTEDGSYQGRA